MSKKSQSKIFACIAFAFSVIANSAVAQISITADSTIGVGGSESIVLSASSPTPETANGLSFAVRVGDGGAVLNVNNTTTGPNIVDLLPTGLLTGATTNFSAAITDPSVQPILASTGTITDFIPTDVTLDSTENAFVELLFDTSGLSEGDTFELFLDAGQLTTFFASGSTELTTAPSSDPFLITVVGTAVPEPSSLSLLALLGSGAMLRRRSRRS